MISTVEQISRMREHYRSDLYSLILDICSCSLSKTSDLMSARLHTTHMQQEPCGSYNPNEQFIVISMILEEVIEALHPPVALPSLLCPLAFSGLTLHSHTVLNDKLVIHS